MTKRIVLPLFVAVLLITTGCLGGSGAGDDTAATATTATPPATSGGDDSTGGSDDDTATGSESGDEWDLSEPVGALVDAGSFTASWTWRANDGNETGTMELRQTVDLDSQRAYTTTTTSDANGAFAMEYFYADGVEYTRIAPADAGTEAMYVATDTDFESNAMVYDRGYVYDASDLDDWTFEGVTTYDGVSVREYVYTGLDRWADSGTASDDDFEVTDVEFRMLVDRDGIARYQRFHVDGVDDAGRSVWFEWEYTVTDVGTTTVDDPDWLTDALEQTQA
ncbi:MAG: hypothetical protein ABEJ22_01115 [Haloferacaceae archaeon]